MKKHGLCSRKEPRHPLFKTWCEMRYRCENPSKWQYKHYGARGIKVCERWQDFAAFVKDMGERPTRATLDRIDPDGDYEPSNCRWATKTQQANNTRANRVLIIDGQQQTMSEWSRVYGVPVGTIWERLNSGWLAADAVQRPVRKHKVYERTQQSNVRSMGKVG